MSGSTPADEHTAAQLSESEEAPSDDLTMVGNLMEVDPVLKTLTVRVDSVDHTFSYNDETQILGNAGQVQGLAGLTEGAEISVSYRQIGELRQAVRVQVL